MALLVYHYDHTTGARYAACYHGQERLLALTEDARSVADRYDHPSPSCWVVVPYNANLTELGWKRRGGRLPICPVHAKESDGDY